MALPSRVVRKRRRLYTTKQLADMLGCSVSTIYRLEAQPLPDLTKRYLAAIRYEIGYYPNRKEYE